MLSALSYRWRAGRLVKAALACLFAATLLSACSDEEKWNGIDMRGAVPDLSFTMTRAGDGKTVTARDFEGKVTLLYFGYTFCPDVCPLTLTNLTQVLKKLGRPASDVRVLFVTVDPERDTPKVLGDYVGAFAPQIVGLRGTNDQLAALAKRYRVAYSVKKDAKSGEIAVTHSSAIYAFDRQGKAQLLFTNFSTAEADVDGMAADLRKILEKAGGAGWSGWISGLL